METELLMRIPAGASDGLAKGVKNAIGALLHVKGTVADAVSDKERTAVGRATVLKDYAKKQAVPELFKARRQFAHAKALVDGQRAQLYAKAAGQPKATDTEWREIIRKMPAGERAAFILTHPEARGPVLREPALAFVGPDVVEHVMKRELIEHHERELAFLDISERTHEIHRVAVAELEKAVVSLPINVSESGEVYAFTRPGFDKWADAELPGASAKEISAIERAEIAA
jgi:hypothetical protein